MKDEFCELEKQIEELKLENKKLHEMIRERKKENDSLLTHQKDWSFFLDEENNSYYIRHCEKVYRGAIICPFTTNRLDEYALQFDEEIPLDFYHYMQKVLDTVEIDFGMENITFKILLDHDEDQRETLMITEVRR